MLPIGFLRQLIGFYGDSLGGVLPRYLEYSMQAFQRNEEQMRQYMHGLFPFNPLEEMNKQNMALFDSAMKMFSPFYGAQGQNPAAAAMVEAGRQAEATIADLQSRLKAMQEQIEKLTKAK